MLINRNSPSTPDNKPHHRTLNMLRHGNQLRLHAKDIERLYNLTGTKPLNIQTVDEWNRFVDRHLFSIEGSTDEEKLIKLLLQDERLQLV